MPETEFATTLIVWLKAGVALLLDQLPLLDSTLARLDVISRSAKPLNRHRADVLQQLSSTLQDVWIRRMMCGSIKDYLKGGSKDSLHRDRRIRASRF
jgi:hypothetical protein